MCFGFFVVVVLVAPGLNPDWHVVLSGQGSLLQLTFIQTGTLFGLGRVQHGREIGTDKNTL